MSLTGQKKLISVVTACYNEHENIMDVYMRVRDVMSSLPQYDYEHIFIDNASTDGTVDILRKIADGDPNVRVIVNARNFGHVRSPYHGLVQANGDAVISVVADMQDPPEMIRAFIDKWEQGSRIVVGIKKQSRESKLMFAVRNFYYFLLGRLSEIEMIKGFTGFGLYDRKIINILKGVDDPYPYFRGLIADLGYDIVGIEYEQPLRKSGRTKNNFYSLYDMAMLGITNHSKVPLRLAAMIGFLLSMISLAVAFGYLIYKLVFWDSFNAGMAPLVIGLFFFSSVQLFFIGIIGEYVGAIHTQVLKRPRVIERERINFNDK